MLLERLLTKKKVTYNARVSVFEVEKNDLKTLFNINYGFWVYRNKYTAV